MSKFEQQIMETTFYGNIVNGNFGVDPEAVLVMGLADDQRLRRMVGMLRESPSEIADVEDFRGCLIDLCVDMLSATPEQIERAFNVCDWMMGEEARHGEA